MSYIFKLKSKKNNERGFSLIQVVVAASLMSVISLGIASLIHNQSQNINYLEDRLSHQNLKIEFDALVNSLCLKQLKDLQIPKLTKEIKKIKLVRTDGNDLYNPYTPDQNNFEMLKIDRVTIQNVTLLGSLLNGRIELSLYPKRIRRGGGPTELKPFKKEINVTINNTLQRKVTGCNSQEGSDYLKGTWVNATDSSSSHAATCAKEGLSPLVSYALGVCASGEVKPRFGKNADKINYKYGTWGGLNVTGGDIVANGMCYHHGQKRDNDGTDRLVAYLCD